MTGFMAFVWSLSSGKSVNTTLEVVFEIFFGLWLILKTVLAPAVIVRIPELQDSMVGVVLLFGSPFVFVPCLLLYFFSRYERYTLALVMMSYYGVGVCLCLGGIILGVFKRFVFLRVPLKWQEFAAISTYSLLLIVPTPLLFLGPVISPQSYFPEESSWILMYPSWVWATVWLIYIVCPFILDLLIFYNPEVFQLSRKPAEEPNAQDTQMNTVDDEEVQLDSVEGSSSSSSSDDPAGDSTSSSSSSSDLSTAVELDVASSVDNIS